MLFGTTVMLSNLAKASPAFYAPIESATVFPELRALLYHPLASIRSKVCHLVGNLCRHNASLYAALVQSMPPLADEAYLLPLHHLPLPKRPPPTPSEHRDQRHRHHHHHHHHHHHQRHDLLFHVIHACGDSDPATRKFACFAVGNSCFHSAKLYVCVCVCMYVCMYVCVCVCVCVCGLCVVCVWSGALMPFASLARFVHANTGTVPWRWLCRCWSAC